MHTRTSVSENNPNLQYTIYTQRPVFSYLEFGPKTGRACNDLAWNPKYTNYLAAAYEKNRNDSSILIFDTSLKTSTNVVVDSASTSAMSKIVPNR